MALRINRCKDQISMIQELLSYIVANSDARVLAHLLDCFGDQVITEDVIKPAAGKPRNGDDLLSLLLNWVPDHVLVTKDVVMTAGGNDGTGRGVVTLVLDRYRDQITVRISLETVCVIARSGSYI